jgi:urease accessory protein
MNCNTLQRFALVALLAAIAVFVGANSAFAHTGIGPTHDLLHGLAHPLTGLDHILAMFAIGLWSAQRGGRAIWYFPLTFMVVMTLGAALGMTSIPMPFVEPAIAISVLMLGLLVATATSLPVSMSAAIVGLFALVHGQAHGTEIPATASALPYTGGLIATTIVLYATGISFGLAAQRLYSSQVMRFAGAAIAVCSVVLCAW